ncbi:MAG: RecQ family ATP-dependent DNA helicase [Phycisphaerales bacterium]|nr:RecQ family ATP-dependent DNA helicase [Phycisphaerales bacterium]
MNDAAQVSAGSLDPRVAPVLSRHWGFDRLRPLQGESIAATLAGRDTLTVLPTGGGKSLCFQAPPLVSGRVTVVVSPLIALMEDQVAGLRVRGVPAGAVHSNLSEGEAAELRGAVASGAVRLLYVAPERLLTPRFIEMVRRLAPGHVAIDEAHCISQWGHDFRPEYRRLAELRRLLPGVPMGAYTATATPRVRQDIIEQLHLRDPAVLVGGFDRPNLTYRVLPRVRAGEQIVEALGRHEGAAAIVYCISRRETEQIAAMLASRGVDAAPYHAGLPADRRARTAALFRDEKLRVVVATVAFGMGVDRSDVRCVIHAAMPRSVEAYQQETGRAGRDGLPAECVLLYSAADVQRWKELIERPSQENPEAAPDPAVLAAQTELLRDMQRFASAARCRHAALSAYFGQQPERHDPGGCGACDVCLGELGEIPEAQETARKILSCVARFELGGSSYGAGYIADVLAGSRAAKVLERGHDRASTFGLLRHLDRRRIASYIDQLIDLGALVREGLEYPVLRLGERGPAILKNQEPARLVEAAVIRTAGRRGRPEPGTAEAPLSDAEARLFEALRAARRELAESRGVPPYVLFDDATLAELCRVRPSSRAGLLTVRGIGQRRAEDFGAVILARLREAAEAQGLGLDAAAGSRSERAERADRGGRADADRVPQPAAGAEAARPHFRRGAPVDDVAAAVGRRPSTVWGYLEDWVREERPADIGPWVEPKVYARVEDALGRLGPGPLRRVFDALEGEVPYAAIRVVAAHREGQRG